MKQLQSSEDRVHVVRARPGVYLYRAAAAHVRSQVNKTSSEREAREMFGDQVTEVVLRAASNPATTSSPSWAGALARTSIDDSIAAITSVSAAAGLIARGMKTNFDGAAQIKVPGHLVDASDAGGWVAEDAPVKVRSLRFNAGVTLWPRKLMVITAYTEEMARSSNLEAVARSLISEATALALDKALLGTQADDGTTPVGILHNATSVTATTGGGMAALSGDIKSLISALVSLGAGRDPVLIANPVQAATLKLVASPKFDMPVLQSSSVAVGTVVCVEGSSFVSAFSNVPEFSVDEHAAFHMEDTNPQDVTGGTPSPAVPVRSMFQIDSIALRMILRASWGMRSAPTDATKVAVSYVTGATW